jgi:hypothetical protein
MSKGAQAYLALAGELLRRMEARGMPSQAARVEERSAAEGE